MTVKEFAPKGRKSQIVVVQGGRSVTLHLVNGRDKFGRNWDWNGFTPEYPSSKELDKLHEEALKAVTAK